MRLQHRTSFSTIRTEGAILPPDLLERIHEGDNDVSGLKAQDYHLQPGERLNEVISRSWNRMLGAWRNFQADLKKLPGEDPGTTVTRERLLLVLFQELGFGRLQTTKALEFEGKSYPVSHEWNLLPIHLVGARVELDKRTPGVAGAARSSPHSMVQELLNRSDDHLWAFLSNGFQLRILRDNISLVRQAYVEFDLYNLFEGETYADFTLLWMLCHESRVEAVVPEEFWLEKWSQQAQEQGARALDQLRGGVEAAIRDLGQGFLLHPANQTLQERLRSGELTGEEYYRQLLRLVYRLIFLFAAEDRGLLHPPESDSEASERYRSFYSTDRLRRLAGRRRGTRHEDLFQGLKLVMGKLGQEGGCPELGLPALGSFLWSGKATAELEPARISNHALLDALRNLAHTTDGGVRRAVDYKNMGAEELGSVYEALLELQPELNTDTGTFTLKVVGGSERKTTGSYYTPSSLIQQLLNTALDPVVEEALKAEDPEAALLDLKICDPACGSGHFLIAAAHRMAKHLATIQTGDPEPSPEATRSALREIIANCIYGVDVNPMAVELCKVNLWLEALDPGKPLSFLDHRIQCGNSLLGATPALIEGGIPDDAFRPIEGDDQKFASTLRKQNKVERAGQMSMFEQWVAEGRATYHAFSLGVEGLLFMEEDTLAAQRQKQAEYERLISSEEYRRSKLIADTWCAAFFWPKREGAPPTVTQSVFRKIASEPEQVSPETILQIDRIQEAFHLFHWHLAFPEVFQRKGESGSEIASDNWSGGFNVVLGNPPWERVKLQEKEWFAGRDDKIANAPNKATRMRLIKNLKEENQALYSAFMQDKRRAEGESHFARNSDRYPLCGRGDVNTYALFAELCRQLICKSGSYGIIVPTGIASDYTYKDFFHKLVQSGSLVSLYDFENRGHLFSELHTKTKFSLLTASSSPTKTISFTFLVTKVSDLRDDKLLFELTPDELFLFNPNTRTCPLFRTRADAELSKNIYQRVPVLINKRRDLNPWGTSFMTMFHMANDSHLFQNQPADLLVPLYEAKMLWHYDHRWASFRDSEPRVVGKEDKSNSGFSPTPRYWVPEIVVEERLEGKEWFRDWLIAFRNITDSRNERSVVMTVIPRYGVGHSASLILPQINTTKELCCLLANFNSIVLDYVARQKIPGMNISLFMIEQLPILQPTNYKPKDIDFIASRVLELVYTAADLEQFAEDLGYRDKPFRWEDERRAQLCAELDAYFGRLYGLSRDELRYILDPEDVFGSDFPGETFRVLRENEVKQYGEFRTKRLVLEAWDRL